MVFAAGYGKRLRPLTLNRPKHVLPLAGKPLVRMVVDALAMAGFEEVGVVVGYQAEKVKNSFQDVAKPKIR
ncbi:MAG: sugar phosphate nucleotidyltransferase, partial [Candidatus Caldarchaeum sp.]|nr:sugar phosphate nucleotidyltransferase [Candidatus Caldarchaeum sp.]MDW8435742.1 sugar phosphate nucleotidyltransferase [Candidatus Caldarchaeum sp.]